MQELAMRYLGKEVLINLVGCTTLQAGTLREVADNAIVLENKGREVVINLNFVTKLREFPTDKNGKKKMLAMLDE